MTLTLLIYMYTCTAIILRWETVRVCLIDVEFLLRVGKKFFTTFLRIDKTNSDIVCCMYYPPE